MGIPGAAAMEETGFTILSSSSGAGSYSLTVIQVKKRTGRRISVRTTAAMIIKRRKCLKITIKV
jgi:hypothetical protein